MVFGPGFNFAQVPVRKPDFDLAGPIMQGFQLGRIPQQMADQRQAQQIANALREAQTRKAGLEADYLPQRMKIAEAQAQARQQMADATSQDAARKQALFQLKQGILKKGRSEGAQLLNDQGEMQGRGLLAPQQSQQPAMGLNPSQLQALAVLDGTSPKIADIDGTKYAVYPGGMIPIGQGPTSREKSYFPSDAKFLEGVEEEVKGANKIGDALYRQSQLINMPNIEEKYRNVIGPRSAAWTLGKAKLSGDKQLQDWATQMEANHNALVAAYGRAFSGQFRKGEQKVVGNLYASANDTIPIMRAKTKAATFLHEVAKQRNELIMDAMRNKGMNPTDAIRYADKLVKRDKVFKKVERDLEQAQKDTQAVLKDVTDEALQETAAKYGMTVEQVRARLKQEGKL